MLFLDRIQLESKLVAYFWTMDISCTFSDLRVLQFKVIKSQI